MKIQFLLTWFVNFPVNSPGELVMYAIKVFLE